MPLPFGRITKLALVVTDEATWLTSALERITRTYYSLEFLELGGFFDSPLSTSAVEVLVRLRCVTSLDVTWLTPNNSNGANLCSGLLLPVEKLGELSQALCEEYPAFLRRLRRLGLTTRCDLMTPLVRRIAGVLGCNLQHSKMSTFSKSADEFHQLLTELVLAAPNLTATELQYRYYDDAEGHTGNYSVWNDFNVAHRLTMDHLHPLLSLKQLLTFSIRHPACIRICLRDISDMGTSWPRVRALSLNPEPYWPDTSQKAENLLNSLASCFPGLQELGIYIPMFRFTEVPIRFPHLRTLSVGASDPGDPQATAAFMLNALPPSCAISSDRWILSRYSLPGLKHIRSELQLRLEGWSQVNDLLKAQRGHHEMLYSQSLRDRRVIRDGTPK
jgi:hypothetical protein